LLAKSWVGRNTTLGKLLGFGIVPFEPIAADSATQGLDDLSPASILTTIEAMKQFPSAKLSLEDVEAVGQVSIRDTVGLHLNRSALASDQSLAAMLHSLDLPELAADLSPRRVR